LYFCILILIKRRKNISLDGLAEVATAAAEVAGSVAEAASCDPNASNNSGGKDSSSGSGDSGGCFLTTAFCSVLEYKDDCSALENLRNFRKDFLDTTKEGQDLLIEYEKISNIISPKILSDKNNKSVCEYVYNNYILSVNDLVDSQKQKAAIEKYKEMVNDFLEHYK